MNEILVSSIVSNRTKGPRVDILIDGKHIQLSADEAINFAHNVIECATGAFADAYLYHFFAEEIKAPEALLHRLFNDFRDYREKLKQDFDSYQKKEKGE